MNRQAFTPPQPRALLTAGIVSRISGSSLVAMPMVGMAKTVSGSNPAAMLTAGIISRISGNNTPAMPTAGMTNTVSGSNPVAMPMAE